MCGKKFSTNFPKLFFLATSCPAMSESTKVANSLVCSPNSRGCPLQTLEITKFTQLSAGVNDDGTRNLLCETNNYKQDFRGKDVHFSPFMNWPVCFGRSCGNEFDVFLPVNPSPKRIDLETTQRTSGNPGPSRPKLIQAMSVNHTFPRWKSKFETGRTLYWQLCSRMTVKGHLIIQSKTHIRAKRQIMTRTKNWCNDW